MRRTRILDPMVAFKERHIKTETSCWLWMGAIDKDGYGRIRYQKKTIPAHRFAITAWIGKPDHPDLLACHTCDTPSCVNPAHLFWGTCSENIQDSVQKKRHAEANKTHCPAGHEYSGSNTIFGTQRGKHKVRRCLICRRATFRQASRRYQERRKIVSHG